MSISYKEQIKNHELSQFTKSKQEETQMGTEEVANVEIGTKDSVSLKPAMVTIKEWRIEEVKKNDKAIGRKIVFVTQYQNQEKPLEISKVKYLKNDKMEVAGTWFNQDEDGKIPKKSALAELLRAIGVSKLADSVGKQVNTVDSEGYLVFKAY